MMRPEKELATYANGGTHVRIFADGTKIREVTDLSVPPVHPEQMDLKITDWCDEGCPWCHERSTPKGRHGDVDATLKFLANLPPGVEIAIGGGDPLSHPDLDRLLDGFSRQGLIASVTVNGKHVERHREKIAVLIERGWLYGLGVSLKAPVRSSEMGPDYAHKVYHLIAGLMPVSELANIPAGSRILILGYKEAGRGDVYRRHHDETVTQCIMEWKRNLSWIVREYHTSFDNLAIRQLEPGRLFLSEAEYERFYMGEDGKYSMYVDAVTQQHAVASYCPERHSWPDSGVVGAFNVLQEKP